ncbi:MAG TPA: serine/threonine-protein kinase [Archangium sp.]|uniref:serine/threonine-protein kinase n=1 Tax=Archangium sp. TaxID=1872627 RepID=UPI002E316EE0|nr:serine/threonine-protein kinase [Archangium sp.]HEX5754633.1 serine/threonine-protein kinase [Archangium sp.]
MDGVQAGKVGDKWLRARRRLLWRQAVLEPLEPQLPLPGTQVGGLVLEARLGAGGYGTVYRARSPGGKPYAVKFIHLPRAAAWAWRELEVLLRLRRLGWVAVRGHGEWPEKAPRFVYLVMEYVQGMSLHTWAGRHNPTARRVAEVVRALARQLAAVHRAGVVHRDVKCANVVVREKDGRPVMVDFGVGTFPGAHPVTGPRVPGTAPYRSPEAEGHRQERGPYEAHARDDLWALGVVLYWLLTGTFPFQVEETGDSLADARALGEALVHQAPEPPQVRNPRVPAALAAVCLRMLEKQPTARYPDAQAVEAALGAALAGADAAWDVPLCQAYGPDTATTEAEEELEDAEEETRWRRLEAYERRHPVRGAPFTPEEPATPAPPTREAAPGEGPPPAAPQTPAPAQTPSPPASEPPRTRGTPWRWGAVVGLGLVLGFGPGLSHRPSPGDAPGVTSPVVAAPPTSGVGPVSGQEVAPGHEPLEGGGGAALEATPTPAPAARAAPPKDTRVKRPSPSPLPTTPALPRQSRGVARTVGGLALTCSLATGCPAPTAPQVRPTPLSLPEAPCPEGSLQAMKELGMREGKYGSVLIPGTVRGPRQRVTVRSGPSTLLHLGGSRAYSYPLPDGTVFSGELFVGPKRVYGRFTQARTPEGHTYPMCLELYEWIERGVLRHEQDGTADTATISTGVQLRTVPRFYAVPERE